MRTTTARVKHNMHCYHLHSIMHRFEAISGRFSKPNIWFGLERTGSKIISKFGWHANYVQQTDLDIQLFIRLPSTAAPAVEDRGLCPTEVFFVKLCKSGGFPLPSPRALVIPYGQHLLPMHAYGHVPARVKSSLWPAEWKQSFYLSCSAFR